MIEDREAKKRSPPLLVFGLAAVAVFVLSWLWGWVLAPWLLPELQDRGLLGDSFGALNTLFAGLAFAGVIAALIMQMHELRLQRRELQLQREELKLTREELKRTAAAQEASADLLEQQLSLAREREVRETQPNLQPRSAQSDSAPQPSLARMVFRIKNEGAPASALLVTSPDNPELRSEHSFLRRGDEFKVLVDYPKGHSEPIRLEVHYTDGRQRRRKQLFRFTPGGRFEKESVEVLNSDRE